MILIDNELIDFDPESMTATRDGGKTWQPVVFEEVAWIEAGVECFEGKITVVLSPRDEGDDD